MTDHNNRLHQYADPSLYNIARILRKQQTDAEEILWQALRNRKVGNMKFRRQHPFENFVLDFYCHEAKLVIEADGAVHNQKEVMDYDNARTARLNELGITILRFTNKEIETDISLVITNIENWIKNRRTITNSFLRILQNGHMQGE